MWSFLSLFTILCNITVFSYALPATNNIAKIALTATEKSSPLKTASAFTTASPFNLTSFPPYQGSLPQPRSSRRNIVGNKDDRKLWPSRDFPYRTMGKITVSTTDAAGKETAQYMCSGSLVGPRHVSTVAHCLQGETWKDGKSYGSNPEGKKYVYRFQANYYNGISLASSNGQVAYRSDWFLGEDCRGGDDVGMLILSDRIGEQVGWLGSNYFDAKVNLQKPVFSNFGYPGREGFERGMMQECVQVLEAGCAGRSLLVDAHSEGGMSGGPLFRNGVQYGVLSRTADPRGVWFAAGENFLRLLRAAREQYP